MPTSRAHLAVTQGDHALDDRDLLERLLRGRLGAEHDRRLGGVQPARHLCRVRHGDPRRSGPADQGEAGAPAAGACALAVHAPLLHLRLASR
eukprot:3598834-Prymnesium_polylepis.1